MSRIFFVVSMLIAGSVFGAQDDTLLTFSTPGPDAYADGTRVLDGESYAVVWTMTGSEFGGLTAEGKAVKETDRLVLVAPLAKEGRCPLTVLTISATAMAQYAGGDFALYLLDTRVKTEDGKTRLAKRGEDGAPETVNAVGEAASDAGEGRLVAASRVKLGAVGVRTEIASPTITAIRIENATVTLKVSGMSAAADYFVVPSTAPDAPAPALDVKPDGDTFTFPRPEGASFFKVIGTRRF